MLSDSFPNVFTGFADLWVHAHNDDHFKPKNSSIESTPEWDEHQQVEGQE